MSNLSRRVLKTMSIFGGVQVITVICSVVRTKAIAIWLGAAGVGLSALFYTVFTFMVTLSQLGIRSSAVRDISQSPHSRVPLTAMVVRRWSLWLGLAGMVVMLAASPLLSYSYFGNLGSTGMFILLAPMVLLMNSVAGESALMQGTGHLKLMANTTMWTAIAGTVLSIPIYKLAGMAGVVPAICFFVILNWLGVWHWRIRTPRPEPEPSRREVISLGRGFIVLGLYMTVSQLIQQGVSLLFIGYLKSQPGGLDEVGYFQAGYTLVNQYVGLIFTAIAMEYFPRLSSAVHSRRATELFVAHEVKLVLWTLIGPATLFIGANTLIIAILYNPTFSVITPFVILATVGTVFRAVSWCIAMVILARGDGRCYIISETLSAIVYLTVNVAMYSMAGISGMGIAYMLWFAIYMAAVYIIYVRRYRCRLPASQWVLVGGAVAVIGVTAVLYLWVSVIAAWIMSAAAMTATVMALTRLMRNKRHLSAVKE